jgi:DsbC/DsbD-like thiol-disulfide interchange protein
LSLAILPDACIFNAMGNLRFPTAIAFLGLAASVCAASPKTEARLLLSAETARPGQTVMAAVELRMPGKWHTYWRNPGDAGKATEIKWKLPPGISVGEIQWPLPEKYVTPPLTTYVYHTNAVLLVPLRLSSGISQGPKEIQAQIAWMECENTCSLGGSVQTATLNVGPDPADSAAASLIESAKKKIPAPGQAISARARWAHSPEVQERHLVLEGQFAKPARFLDFYPYAGDDHEFSGETELLATTGNGWAMRKTVQKFSDKWPRQVRGLIVAGASASAITEAYEVELLVEDLAAGSR